MADGTGREWSQMHGRAPGRRELHDAARGRHDRGELRALEPRAAHDSCHGGLYTRSTWHCAASASSGGASRAPESVAGRSAWRSRPGRSCGGQRDGPQHPLDPLPGRRPRPAPGPWTGRPCRGPGARAATRPVSSWCPWVLELVRARGPAARASCPMGPRGGDMRATEAGGSQNARVKEPWDVGRRLGRLASLRSAVVALGTASRRLGLLRRGEARSAEWCPCSAQTGGSQQPGGQGDSVGPDRRGRASFGAER